MKCYEFKDIPKKYNNNFKELNKLVEDYNPAKILINKFFPNLGIKEPIVVVHKPIGQEARFYKNKIFLNFANDSKYLWLCLCHETAHILLRLINWENSGIYRRLKNNYKEEILPKAKIGIIYGVDQSCAILIQAYCENILNIRPLRWKDWESTFRFMDVEEIGKILWPEWLKFIKKKDGLSILDWIKKIEEKGLFKKVKFSK